MTYKEIIQKLNDGISGIPIEFSKTQPLHFLRIRRDRELQEGCSIIQFPFIFKSDTFCATQIRCSNDSGEAIKEMYANLKERFDFFASESLINEGIKVILIAEPNNFYGEWKLVFENEDRVLFHYEAISSFNRINWP